MKHHFPVFALLLALVAGLPALFAGQASPVFNAWVSPASPAGIWEASGEAFPAEKIVEVAKDAGITEIDLCIDNTNTIYYDSRVPGSPSRLSSLPPDTVDRFLAASEKVGLRVWLIPTFPAKASTPEDGEFFLISRRGLEYARARIAELGERFAKRYPKAVAGFVLHEINRPEVGNPHADELDQFRAFCEREFQESYPGDRMPAGQTGELWDRRFNLYRVECLNAWSQALINEGAKYGMQASFILYDPERHRSFSAAWGYDTLFYERNCQRIWCQEEGYPTLRGAYVDCGFSYRGSDVPRALTQLFREYPAGLFEIRSPFFPEWLQAHYDRIPSFKQTYGDFLTGYSGKSQRIRELFLGRENAKRWVKATRFWQGAESLSRIGVVASSLPNILRNPTNPGAEYERCAGAAWKAVTARRPATMVLAGSLITLDPVELRRRFDLLVLPENQGIGMTREYVESLKRYVELGGKLIGIASPVTTARRDLTEEKDATAELFGVAVRQGTAPGFVRIGGKKVWSSNGAASVTGTPLPGTEFFPVSLSKESEGAFAAALDRLLPESEVSLTGNGEIAFYNACRKDGMVCLSLPASRPSRATLRLRLPKGGYRMRNLFTGETLAEGSEETFAAGVPVQTRYDSEPLAVAVGPAERVSALPVVLSGAKSSVVFADLGKIAVIQNPEVPLLVPEKPGLKVGIWMSCLGSETLLRELSGVEGLNAFLIPRLDAACVEGCDVVLVPQPKSAVFYQAGLKELRSGAERGKGVLLCHDALLKAVPVFPEVLAGKPVKKKQLPDATLRRPDGGEVQPGFSYDHYALALTDQATVLATAADGSPVAAWGAVGKGRVAVIGTLLGWFGNDGAGKADGTLPESERKLLVETLKQIGGKP